MTRIRIASLLCAAVLVSGPAVGALARTLWEGEEAYLSLDAELRNIALYTRQTGVDDFESAADPSCVFVATFADCPSFDTVGQTEVGQGFTRIRLELEARATEWLSAVVIYDNEIQYGGVDTLEANLGREIEESSFSGAEGTLSRGTHHDWRHALYRGYLRIEAGRFELGLGRQRVAWGVGRLWTPIDRFSAIPPLSLQPDVTPGIDSIDGRINFDGFSYLQFVYAPGATRSLERWALRLHGVLFDSDVSLMGGIFEDAPTVGADFARNLGGGAIRFAAVYTRPQTPVWLLGDPAPAPLPDYWQALASFDINLEFGTGLYLLAEYLYNGNALGFGEGKAGPLLPLFTAGGPNGDSAALVGPPDPARFGASRVISNATHQIGTQLGYDLTPELRGDFVMLVDLSGGSAAFFPNLRYSPLDRLEMTLGVQLFAGGKDSQYGNSEPLVYLLADWYF